MWESTRESRLALPHKDVAAAIETVRGSASAQPAVRLAFEFLVLTATRSGEVRLATWTEIDTAGAVWTISAIRMKAKREHRVPLCRRALEILDAARALGDGNPLVFPMRSGKAISATTLPKMLQNHRIAAVAHGFRSSFRDWAAEETDHPREVIEAALAHVVQNKVEAAYARSDLFERRRRLMDDWAMHLEERRSQAPATAIAPRQRVIGMTAPCHSPNHIPPAGQSRLNAPCLLDRSRPSADAGGPVLRRP